MDRKQKTGQGNQFLSRWRRWCLLFHIKLMLLGVGEMTQQLQCLPCKHNNCSSDQQKAKEKRKNTGWTLWPTCNCNLRWLTHRIPRLSWLVRLTIPVSSRFDQETPIQGIMWKSDGGCFQTSALGPTTGTKVHEHSHSKTLSCPYITHIWK